VYYHAVVYSFDSLPYFPEEHDDDAALVPLFVTNDGGEELTEKEAFHRMQLLLANHLHFTYERGELQWPKTRAEINEMYNHLPHVQFPNAVDNDKYLI